MSKPKWLSECPPARDARGFRLQVKVGAYCVGRHDDSNGNRYWYVADEDGRLMTDRDDDSWSDYRDALRAARRLWLRRLGGQIAI